MNIYDVGDVVLLVGEFRNPAGTLVDPTTITCQVKTPSGSVALYTFGVDAQLTKLATGRYQLSYEPSTDRGIYPYRFAGTGTNKGAGGSAFMVRDSQFF